MALAMVVVFLYGDLIWGIFPLVKDASISYEAHLLGSLAGIILAVYYRHEGPQKKEVKWKDEDDEDDEDIDEGRESDEDGHNKDVDHFPKTPDKDTDIIKND